MAAGLGAECRNPFRSIIVRAVEVVYACDEALRIIAEYERPDSASVACDPVATTGHGCTEAPRGILYHRYRLDDDGTILDAQDHSAHVAEPSDDRARPMASRGRPLDVDVDVDDAELGRRCEQAIRNYDPCISCATHFLDLTVHRT